MPVDTPASALTLDGQAVPLEALADRAAALSRGGDRAVLGLAGPPGAGKSALAARLVGARPPGTAVIVPLDGFHLGQAIINGTPLAERKGAIDTFDVEGYAALLRRVRADDGTTVYAPLYSREIEEPIAASIAVPPTRRLIITEGNYLLADEPPWRAVRELLDEVWFLDADDDVRLPELIARHEAAGKSAQDARRWALGSDARNTDLVRATRDAADLVVVRRSRVDAPG